MASKDYTDFVNTMGAIFTATAILTLLIFALYYGIAQYEAGALNTWF